MAAGVDVALVSPPFSLREDYGDLEFMGQYGPTYNLLALAAALEAAGYTVRVLDFSYSDSTLEECARETLRAAPRYVGVAIHFTFLADRGAEIVRQVAQMAPDVTVVAGGVHFSAVPEETMAACPIDVGFLGEAEESLIEVIRRLDDGRAIDGMNGVVHRTDEGVVVEGTQNLVAQLDALPFPAYSAIDLSHYGPTIQKEKGGFPLPLLTSRGCPFKCTFCDRTILGSRVRYNSLDYIGAMIDHFVETLGVTTLQFEDENISLGRKRFEQICSVLRAKHLQHGITWGCTFRADRVFEDTADLLYASGCRTVQLGLESGSQTMIDNYLKDLDVTCVPEACRRLRAAGITTSGSFIVGGPGETRETLQETIDLVRRVDLDYVFVWYFAPIPGAVATQDLESRGVVLGGYGERTGHHPVFIPEGLTREELVDGYRGVYRAFYTRPRAIARVLRDYGVRGVPRLVSDGLKFLVRFVLPALKARLPGRSGGTSAGGLAASL